MANQRLKCLDIGNESFGRSFFLGIAGGFQKLDHVKLMVDLGKLLEIDVIEPALLKAGFDHEIVSPAGFVASGFDH